MVFPQTPLPARVRIWPGVNPTSSPLTWPDGTDITAKVRVDQGITTEYGRGNEAADIDAASYSISVDNRTGDFTPDNPLGAYFGGLRRNTPIRDSTDVMTDNFNRTVAAGSLGLSSGGTFGPISYSLTTGTDWSVNGSQARAVVPAAGNARYAIMNGANASNPAGKIDFTCPVVATGDPIIMSAITHYHTMANMHFFSLVFDLSGTLRLRVSRYLDGVYADLSTVTLGASYSAGQTFTLRWDACGPTILLKAWLTGSAEPAWQMQYDDPDTQKGGQVGFNVWRQPANSNAGSLTFGFDNVSVESTEFQGYIAELPTRWDQSGKDSIVPLRASGILRRLQQGSTPLKSPLYRQLTGTNDVRVKPSAYWPMEDDSSATSGANALAQGSPMSVTDVVFGADTSLISSSQTARLNTPAARAVGVVRGARNGGTGFSAMMFFKLPAGVVASDFITVSATGTPSSVTQWVIRVSATAVAITGYDSSGGSIVAPGGLSWGAVDPTQWTAIQMETEVVGANTNWSLIWHQVGSTDYYSSAGSYASPSPSKASGITITSSASLNGTLVGHVWLGENVLPFTTNTFSLVSNGYVGELSGTRFARLCSEEGIPGGAESGSVELMGAQGFDSILSLLRECVAAEYGVLYESGYGIYMRPRSKRYNRAVTLALSLATGGASAPLEPTFDDAALRNEWQISRKNGSQGAIITDATSVAAEGRYDDSATINVATDDVLVNHAGWRVFLGTRQLTRWPSIEFSIAARPILGPGWRQSHLYGQRITLATTGLIQTAGLGVDVIVEGWTSRKSVYDWDVRLNCSPASPWSVSLLDEAAMRLDTDSSYLLTTVNPTATSLTVRTVSGPTWTTAAADLPFDILIEGEQMTVTAVGAPAGSDQTFTVTRSVNGISRSHTGATTTAVTLYQPFFLPL